MVLVGGMLRRCYADVMIYPNFHYGVGSSRAGDSLPHGQKHYTLWVNILARVAYHSHRGLTSLNESY